MYGIDVKVIALYWIELYLFVLYSPYRFVSCCLVFRLFKRLPLDSHKQQGALVSVEVFQGIGDWSAPCLQVEGTKRLWTVVSCNDVEVKTVLNNLKTPFTAISFCFNIVVSPGFRSEVWCCKCRSHVSTEPSLHLLHPFVELQSHLCFTTTVHPHIQTHLEGPR